ncbi:hypothetical protein KC19_6G024800 [Ceratodon purpureus]|uniref:Uncharacterized protein n=1 Tax=Ceratodon purpureus TaxID=3225 RepID=A0A8T0H9H1_CERPU|nr:hypothetical protein KC19_6G024800 [Ceratodon purpureus]
MAVAWLLSHRSGRLCLLRRPKVRPWDSLHIEFPVYLCNGYTLVVAAIVRRDDQLLPRPVTPHKKLLICIIIVHLHGMLLTLANLREIHEIMMIPNLHVQRLLGVVHNLRHSRRHSPKEQKPKQPQNFNPTQTKECQTVQVSNYTKGCSKTPQYDDGPHEPNFSN